MQIKAEEISSIIKEKIKGFDKQVDVKETGSVIQVGDGAESWKPGMNFPEQPMDERWGNKLRRRLEVGASVI